MQLNITKEHLQQSKGLLDDKRPDVIKGVLEVLEQLSIQESYWEMLNDKEIIQKVLRLVIKDVCPQKGLTFLVNLSQCQETFAIFDQIGLVKQVCRYIKEKTADLDFYYKLNQEEVQSSKLVTELESENKEDKEHKTLNLNQEGTPKSLITLSLMLLTNLMQNVNMQGQFIQYNDKKLKGFYFKIFLNAYMHQQSSETFHFYGHIMQSLSNVRGGRWFMIKDFPNFFEKIRRSILDANKERRIQVIGTIKNVCFEHAEHECVIKFMKARLSEYLLTRLIQIIEDSIKLDDQQQVLLKQTKKSLENLTKDLDLKQKQQTMEQFIETKNYQQEVEIIMDIFLILTQIQHNKNKILTKLHPKLVRDTFSLLNKQYLQQFQDEYSRIQKNYTITEQQEQKKQKQKIIDKKKEVKKQMKPIPVNIEGFEDSESSDDDEEMNDIDD